VKLVTYLGILGELFLILLLHWHCWLTAALTSRYITQFPLKIERSPLDQEMLVNAQQEMAVAMDV